MNEWINSRSPQVPATNRTGRLMKVNCSDVKRGQNLEAEAEAEAKNNYEKSTK